MTVIDLTSPYAMQQATLLFGADDYTAAVSQAELQPTAASTEWRAIDGSVRRKQQVASWVLALGLAQDDDPAGLTRYLLAHENEEVEVTLTPVDGGTEWTATVILSPASVGGTAGADLAVSQVNLPVIGKPVATDPTP